MDNVTMFCKAAQHVLDALLKSEQLWLNQDFCDQVVTCKLNKTFSWNLNFLVIQFWKAFILSKKEYCNFRKIIIDSFVRFLQDLENPAIISSVDAKCCHFRS